MKFKRAREIYDRQSGVTMWGNNNANDWQDVKQGSANNCWIFSSFGSISEKIDYIKRAFLVDELNEVGIYAFKFYILGKPWIVSIDDYLPYVQSETTLKFAKLGILQIQ
jgi:hypothetical protein